ncbi:MAG TPA: hypothetical protein VHV29_21055 [Terriglobales bacterium]|jgi:hypothetical protein|nr:hypothetical protein [Terriglobales bacterium]
MMDTFQIENLGRVRSQEVHRKFAQAKSQRELIDNALENAWLADQCIRLALSVAAEAPDVQEIVHEILGEINPRLLRDAADLTPVTQTPTPTPELTPQVAHATLMGLAHGGRNDGSQFTDEGRKRGYAVKVANGTHHKGILIAGAKQAAMRRGKSNVEIFGAERAAVMAAMRKASGADLVRAEKSRQWSHNKFHVGRGVVKPGCKLCEKTELVVTSVEVTE